jgi:uncharacterized protein with PQ loop repeat
MTRRRLPAFGEAIGWVGLAFSVWVNVPQAWTIYHNQSCQDVSPITYLLLLACVSCFLVHAIHRRVWVFVISNSLAVLVASTVLLLIWRYHV